ncbi:intraflagellar transport 140 [Trypanosoma theileri]|uniref:Intraflagellar transport 140 n=1 Tax=Trypanosoma theileri TaxID=67003 RepID=A0A1X0P7F5_9TRYP|nr:intraflagellar transport 140 [Trypanosoma theileri]ORC92553.1 intraflagellar transport 140 [Trypanosoma theileri]
MLLYFVNGVTSHGVVDTTLVVPHPTLPIVASVWTNPLHVLVTDAEGDLVADHTFNSTAKVGSKITCMAWHPTHPLLVIGWDNGKLMTWMTPSEVPTNRPVGTAVGMSVNKQPQQPVEVEKAAVQHGEGSVVQCAWSASGVYLLTTSSKLRAVLWSVEHSSTNVPQGDDEVITSLTRSTVTPLWSVPTESVMTHVLHIGPPPVSSLKQTKMIELDESIPTMAPPRSRADDDGDDDCAFLLASNGGKQVFALTEEQKLFPLFLMEEPPATLLYDAVERHLVAFSTAHVINVYQISEPLASKLLLRRKLSMPSPTQTAERFTITMRWAASGVLAFASGDDRVRFFDIHSDRVYFVTHPAPSTTHITNIATLERKGLLAMSTTEGALAVYQRQVDNQHHGITGSNMNYNSVTPLHNHHNNNNNNNSSNGGGRNQGDPASEWELVTVVDVDGRVSSVHFTTAGHIIVALASGKLQILRETVRKRAWDGVSAATQISMEMVVVESITGCQCLLKSNSKIRGMSIAFPTIGLWNGQQIDLYTVNESTSTASLTNFIPTTSPAFAVHAEGVFFVKDANRVTFSNFQLVTIGQLAFTEAEGTPVIIDVMGDFVVTISSKNAMRLGRVSSREVRPLGPPRQLQLPDDNVIVVDAKVNAQGRRVVLMTRCIAGDKPDSRIWVYDLDTDLISCYDFAQRGEVPDAVYWNTPEPNSNTIGELGYLLLACETHQVKNMVDTKQLNIQDNTEAVDETIDANTTKPHGAPSHQNQQQNDPSSGTTKRDEEVIANEAMPDLENFAEKKQRMEDERYLSGFSGVNPLANRTHSVVTLFATNKGLVVHNAVLLKRYHICLVGLTIPDFLLASVRINGNPSNPEDYMIEQKRLRDFEGLKTEKDAAVLEALMKFSYYSTIGNMDEAYRCVKTIKSPTVWHSLAKMCVFSGRLDVAKVCLAQMQDGVAASALREACTKYAEENDVHLATLACSLGLVKECEDLLRKAKRYDLITDLLLACGKFEQAQRHARRFDRIRVYPVAYKYAQFMESFSNFEAAIMWYYNAKCLSTDVARIYFQNNRLSELRDLVIPPSSKNKGDSSNNNGNNVKLTENDAPNGKSGEKSGGKNGEDALTKKSSISLKEGTDNIDSNEEKRTGDEEEVRATFERLFAYNKELLLWWAQHCERRRHNAEALKFYTLAEDSFNVVRLLCSEDPPRIDEALDIVNKTADKMRLQAGTGIIGTTDMEPLGAAFFIGLYYERTKEVSAALQYYKMAGAWRAASRVAKAHQRYGELLNLSLASDDKQLMLDSATFLEHNNAYDKSVELYHRIGDIQKAIDVCIKGGLYEAMHRISTTLDAQSDPELFLQMATHFVESGHYNKAAEMFVFAKAFPRALELCVERNVPLTDEMAEAITSEANCRDLTADQRTALLRQIAGIAKDQGNWNLACKKYTQLGERVKAMKMLMRGGDVNKVIFFANHSRNAEIFTLAGNFLQSQNWNTDPNIHKHIVLFYTKAKAFTHLISFTDAYAQMQIDENRNYYEAWRAIDDCLHVLDRNRDGLHVDPNLAAREEALRTRRELVGLVVKAVKLLADTATDSSQAKELIAVCSDLIKRSRPNHQDHDTLAAAIRIGDVFALLVRYYYENAQSAKDALRVVESMVKHSVEPQFFVERDLLEAVCAANGRKLTEFIGDSNTKGMPESGKGVRSGPTHA